MDLRSKQSHSLINPLPSHDFSFLALMSDLFPLVHYLSDLTSVGRGFNCQWMGCIYKTGGVTGLCATDFWDLQSDQSNTTFIFRWPALNPIVRHGMGPYDVDS